MKSFLYVFLKKDVINVTPCEIGSRILVEPPNPVFCPPGSMIRYVVDVTVFIQLKFTHPKSAFDYIERASSSLRKPLFRIPTKNVSDSDTDPMPPKRSKTSLSKLTETHAHLSFYPGIKTVLNDFAWKQIDGEQSYNGALLLVS